MSFEIANLQWKLFYFLIVTLFPARLNHFTKEEKCRWGYDIPIFATSKWPILPHWSAGDSFHSRVASRNSTKCKVLLIYVPPLKLLPDLLFQTSKDENYIFCTCETRVNVLEISTGKIVHSVEHVSLQTCFELLSFMFKFVKCLYFQTNPYITMLYKIYS